LRFFKNFELTLVLPLQLLILGAIFASAGSMLDEEFVVELPTTIQVMRSEHSSSSQHQRTSISLDRRDLNEPANLSIAVPKGIQINGQVAIKELVIHRFENESVRINLSRHLKPGRNTIKITGTYQPQNMRILIEFSSRNSTISQQSGGSGTLQHVLVFDVR
jgi:hypothetical protein